MPQNSTRTAWVKYPVGKILQTKYGERINAVVMLDDGEEVKLWATPGDQDLESLQKGQEVYLVQVNGKWKLDTHQPAQQQDLFGELLKLQEMVAGIAVRLEQIELGLNLRRGG